MATDINCDDRKFRKPMMEKKRRARINESLDNLKQILMECDPHSVNKKNAKLEKADILEMTVRYLQSLKKKPPTPTYYNEYSATSRYGSHSQNYVAAPFSSGSQMYYGSSSYSYQKTSSCKSAMKSGNSKNGIWRPW